MARAVRESATWIAPAGVVDAVVQANPTLTSGDSTSASARLFAAAALAVALLLLSLAAIPEWVVRPERVALVLANWRVEIAASGLSALFAALIVFLIGTSRI